MDERIKSLRKNLGLTQQAFADKLKVSRDNIANYENGRSSPTAAVVSLICTTFGVDEHWLRTGEGKMYRPVSRDDEIAKLFGKVLKDDPSSFRSRFCSALAGLSEDEWAVAEKFFKSIVENKKEQQE